MQIRRKKILLQPTKNFRLQIFRLQFFFNQQTFSAAKFSVANFRLQIFFLNEEFEISKSLIAKIFGCKTFGCQKFGLLVPLCDLQNSTMVQDEIMEIVLHSPRVRIQQKSQNWTLSLFHMLLPSYQRICCLSSAAKSAPSACSF